MGCSLVCRGAAPKALTTTGLGLGEGAACDAGASSLLATPAPMSNTLRAAVVATGRALDALTTLCLTFMMSGPSSSGCGYVSARWGVQGWLLFSRSALGGQSRGSAAVC